MGAARAERTFLFTDIEGSTRLWQADADSMRERLADHDDLVRQEVGRTGGTVFKHTGDGCCAVFIDPGGALAAAVALPAALAPTGLRIRMGVHTGPAQARDDDWFGLTLNRCARIMAAAHGGQTLVSASAVALIGTALPPDTSLRDLGHHALRDLDEPEHLYQLDPPGPPVTFPPPRTVAPVIGLPPDRTTFVGRHDELARLALLLDEHPLVTITGVGGTGKTRLAVRAAAEIQAGFPGGAAFVDLAAATEPGQVDGLVARAAGHPTPESADAAALAAFLSYRRALVVIDNAEHVVDEVAEVVDLLLDRCPRLRLLVTSREPLAVEGEHVERIRPLPAEDAEGLFRQRAGRLPDDAGTDEAIAELCTRLDGLPLAIELAAARATQLGPGQVQALLDGRLALLTGGVRRVRHRQRTLEATMDWSYDLLDDAERRLLRRLSVLAGDLELDAVVGICAGPGERAEDVLTTFGSLVDKSLVVPGGSLLETVRAYAADKLAAAGETAEVRNRHLRWHLDALDGLVEGGTLDQHRAVLEPRLADLQAATTWALDRGDQVAAARLAARSWPVHVLRLELAEAERLLALAPPVDERLPLDDRLRWRLGAMWARGASADALRGLHHAAEVLALAPPRHSARPAALAFQAQAAAHLDPPEARRLLGLAWAETDPDHPERPVQLRTVEALSHLLDLDLARAADGFAAAAEGHEPPGYFARSALVLEPLCRHLAGDRDRAAAALERADGLPGSADTYLQSILRSYVHAVAAPTPEALRALQVLIDERDPVATATRTFAVGAGAELALTTGDDVTASRLFAGLAEHGWHLRHEALSAHVRTRLRALGAPPDPPASIDELLAATDVLASG